MTSIEWLIEQMFKQGYFDGNKPLTFTNLDHLQQQAKEMHKQEIIDAHDMGYIDGGNHKKVTAEMYFEETFVSKGSDEVELPQQEISDEEIEKEISKRYMHPTMDYAFRDACKWYREQLKQL